MAMVIFLLSGLAHQHRGTMPGGPARIGRFRLLPVRDGGTSHRHQAVHVGHRREPGHDVRPLRGDPDAADVAGPGLDDLDDLPGQYTIVAVEDHGGVAGTDLGFHRHDDQSLLVLWLMAGPYWASSRTHSPRSVSSETASSWKISAHWSAAKLVISVAASMVSSLLVWLVSTGGPCPVDAPRGVSPLIRSRRAAGS